MRWLKENPIPAAILVFALCSAPFIVSSILFRDKGGAYRNEDIPALIEQAAKQAEAPPKNAGDPDAGSSKADTWHPWLVKVKGHYTLSYIGPQTPEAIMATVYGIETQTEEYRRELKRVIQRVLDSGFVYQDSDDIIHLGPMLKSKIQEKQTDPDFDEDRLISGWMRWWGRMKEAMDHSHKTGEGTLYVKLDPENRGISMRISNGPEQIASRPVGPNQITDEEVYNISRHGIAPEGYRLLFVNDFTGDPLPLDQVPFFKDHEHLKDMSDADLNHVLKGIPSILSSSEGAELSNAMWLSMLDRYDAALLELASRGGVPEPFAARAASAPPPPPLPAEPSAERSQVPPGAAPPPGFEEAPPSVPQDATAAAELERRLEYAEAYLTILEKRAKTGEITPMTRSLIAERIRQLRILQNPNLLAPSTEPDGDNGPPAAPR